MERRAQISTSGSLLCERQKGNQIIRDMCAVSMVKGIEEACRRCVWGAVGGEAGEVSLGRPQRK